MHVLMPHLLMLHGEESYWTQDFSPGRVASPTMIFTVQANKTAIMKTYSCEGND